MGRIGNGAASPAISRFGNGDALLVMLPRHRRGAICLSQSEPRKLTDD
ncbi:MAG: hypothetical protein ACOY6K_05995 [Pseudomonadota bacterium]